MFTGNFLWQLALLPAFILSLSVHEFAHAWTAWRLGDDTAARAGRLTLNPIAHIDVLGTLILPLWVGIGWAKPVPYDPSRFRRDVHMGPGSTLVSAAGPASNLLLALTVAIVFGLMRRFTPDLAADGSPVWLLLRQTVVLNCALAMFNLLPVPPLDGAGLIGGLLPYRLRDGWNRFQQLGPFLLIGLLFLGGRFIAGPVYAFANFFLSIARAIS